MEEEAEEEAEEAWAFTSKIHGPGTVAVAEVAATWVVLEVAEVAARMGGMVGNQVTRVPVVLERRTVGAIRRVRVDMVAEIALPATPGSPATTALPVALEARLARA
jgi:hypothetical protein